MRVTKTMTNTTCPYCHKSNCALNLQRLKDAGTLTLEASTVGDLSPDQLALATKLEGLFYESTSRGTWRDMEEPALALEGAPVDASFITTEEPRETIGGLLEPAADHWFSLEQEESRLSAGLIRPDALPSEQEEQLRQLFLSKPSPQPSRKLTTMQLQALGFVADDDVTDAIDPSRITKGGLIEPL
jgi:hypothetical protein